MWERKSTAWLAGSVLFAVFLWGGNNTGVKFLVGCWPPVFVGATRFLAAGLLLLLVLRYSSWLGAWQPVAREVRTRLWLRGGLSLAVYIVTFNWALRFTSASHVTLLLAAAPLWAMLWEAPATGRRQLLRRGIAVALTVLGVAVLFWPALRGSRASWPGEALGVLASLLWANYGHQCRALGASLNGAEVTAHTMWRAGVWLAPVAAIEVLGGALPVRADLVLVQAYCVAAGGVVAFALWANALRHWETSRVLLFNNLIPVSTMAWASLCLGEPLTPTFGLALVLISAGVMLGQAPPGHQPATAPAASASVPGQPRTP